MKSFKILLSFLLLVSLSLVTVTTSASAQFQDATFQTPTTYRYISSGFGNRYDGFHYGLDLPNSLNTPVVAAADGVVSRADRGTYGTYGNVVDIKHEGGAYLTRYAHLNSFSSKVYYGATVKKGDVIGYMGETGNAEGIHLHYELKVGSSNVDPAQYTGDWVSAGSSYKYKYMNGTYHSGWKVDRGNWYFLDNSTNLMITGWMQSPYTYKWFYFNSAGVMQKGWQQMPYSGKWFYLNYSDGSMHTGWLQNTNTGKWFYLSEKEANGIVLGQMMTGWLYLGGKTYYLEPATGAMVTGTRVIDGKTYTFNSSGHLQ